MTIGVDFDNTIVCYDGVFRRIAVERGLVPENIGESKAEVKEYLCSRGREEEWTELQGYGYGPGMVYALAFPGVADALLAFHRRGHDIRIISHKTKQPYRGEPYDLHAAAWDWLDRNAFFDAAAVGLRREDVYLELTKADKMLRIADCGCNVFIDDLYEFLLDDAFPVGVRRYLFDPNGAAGLVGADVEVVGSWSGFAACLRHG